MIKHKQLVGDVRDVRKCSGCNEYYLVPDFDKIAVLAWRLYSKKPRWGYCDKCYKIGPTGPVGPIGVTGASGMSPGFMSHQHKTRKAVSKGPISFFPIKSHRRGKRR